MKRQGLRGTKRGAFRVLVPVVMLRILCSNGFAVQGPWRVSLQTILCRKPGEQLGDSQNYGPFLGPLN